MSITIIVNGLCCEIGCAVCVLHRRLGNHIQSEIRVGRCVVRVLYSGIVE